MPPADASVPEAPASPGPPRARVLLVEDSPTQARRLQLLLPRAGLEVVHAPRVEAAWALLAAQRFDLVLTDLEMPGPSGLDLCARIKADPRLRAVPVIILTAATDPANALRGLAAGAEGFMTKDQPADAVVARLRRILGQPPGGGGAQAPVAVTFLGGAYRVAASREHVLEFLVSAFEDVTVLEAERRRTLEERLRLEEQQRVAAMRARLVNVAAHELRTPLTPMRIELSLLANGRLGPLQPRQRKAVEVLERNLARLEHIAQEVVEAAQLQAGSLKLDLRPVDLADAVRDAATRFSGRAAEQGIALGALAPAALVVRADAGRIRRVLDNFLDNALRFTPPGGAIEVTTRQEEGLGVVEVRDTGQGLTAAQMDGMFQPFSHGQDPQADARPASGLGLYIGRGILEQHGGRLWCRSEGLGKGATFGFALPLAADAPTERAAVPAATDAASR